MGYRLNTGVDTNGLPLYLVKEFLKEIDIPTIVECGTAGGESIIEAARFFHDCYTIEIQEERKIAHPLNVNCLYGNSVDMLPGLITHFINLKKDCAEGEYMYVLFWLDSHFDGDKPEDSSYKDCYLLEELEIISEYSQDAIVIVDDCRLFLGQPPHPNDGTQWPTIQEIFGKFKDKFPYHFTTITDDYIISIPDRLKWILDREWMARYKIRYPDEPEVIKNAVKLAYQSLLKYIQ